MLPEHEGRADELQRRQVDEPRQAQEVRDHDQNIGHCPRLHRTRLCWVHQQHGRYRNNVAHNEQLRRLLSQVDERADIALDDRGHGVRRNNIQESYVRWI